MVDQGSPSEWQDISLGEVLDYEQPTRYLVKGDEYEPSGTVPVLTAGKTFILGFTEELNGVFDNLPTILFDDFTTSCHYVDFNFKVKSSACKMLKARNSSYNLKYLYYVMKHLPFEPYDHKRYWISEYSKMQIKMPRIEEQNLIAEVLSDIDDLIRTTKNELSKMRNIRMSLLQSLDKLFSTTTPLSMILDTPITDGPHLTPKFLDTGVPFLSVNNISDNKIDLSSLRYISKEDDLKFSKKCKPRLHDILLGKAASVGKVAIVENDFDFNIWSPLAMIRVNKNNNPFFIFYCFQTSNILEQITLLTNSSSQGNIGMGDIEKIRVPKLDISLQNELALKLRDFDKKTESLSRLVTKYEGLKQGMMNDLLTGKVRLV